MDSAKKSGAFPDPNGTTLFLKVQARYLGNLGYASLVPCLEIFELNPCRSLITVFSKGHTKNIQK